MSEKPVSLAKNPTLKPAEDFYTLRRTGIGYIEQMGSRLWTDYNTHDPGITILDALCYALTDLAYRTHWDIKDILMPKAKSRDSSQPFPNQSFFTARDILTVNPSTPDDFRRLLIDLEGVRNAWVICKECACEFNLYAWCDDQKQLTLGYHKPSSVAFASLKPRGLYDVLLELETDPQLGDLNDRKIEQTHNLFDSKGKPHAIIMELRFPVMDRDQQKAFAAIAAAPFDVLIRFGATRTFDVLTDPSLKNDDERNNYLHDHWRTIFYISFELTTPPSEDKPLGEKVTLDNVSMKLLSDVGAKNASRVTDLANLLSDKSPGGFIVSYQRKLRKVQEAIEAAKALLHTKRNLDEDFCTIKGVDVEDVAVCADVEVAADADIERVQAEIWFQVERYFNPPIPFYTLQELLDEGIPVEDIFNGPELTNGFIKAEDLEMAGLKPVLRTSDLINLLMDIKGVIAINTLLLTKYDSEGKVIKGAADPVWHNGKPVFDANKTSASGVLFVSEAHQPRLYRNFSRFLFYKNGLPFLPRMDEAEDTLTLLRGEAERPKIKSAPKDFPVPAGSYRHPEDYFPLQYSFPLTYGIGTEGLPAHASSKRHAQARQLKAYLMVFEQLLGNAFAQVAHTADLFSLSPDVQRSYFVREFSKDVIQGYEDITKGLDQTELEKMTETSAEFHERRNRFLNHLMARFGEQFTEYALLLTNFQGQHVARKRLIDDKISFLKAYPGISHDRCRAFNYRENPCSSANIPGLKKRVSLLLGYPNLAFAWQLSEPPAPFTVKDYQLTDPNGVIWLQGNLNVTDVNEVIAKQKALKEIADILSRMTQSNAYQLKEQAGGTLSLNLNNEINEPLGEHPQLFNTKAEALAFRDELTGWSSNERSIVVEHILLRPKFPGDALYPACVEGDCDTCDADPYSFRLTFVMPGWTEPYNVNLDLRRFADRTIREETPAHLLPKICWVGNDGFIDTPCDPVVSELLELLLEKGLNAQGVRPDEEAACTCATIIYGAFSAAFKRWYEDKTLAFFQPEVLQTQLQQAFNAVTVPDDAGCVVVLPDLWDDIKTIMVNYFQKIALNGWQFERFEEAWCKWLEANSLIDWAEERLHEQVETVLLNSLVADVASLELQKKDICKHATAILANYGRKFYEQMDADFKAGKALQDFKVVTPDIALSTGLFREGTANTLMNLLVERYGVYQEVSYRLWILVNLLGKLRNTYPGATLHDCDDGSDQNPVRLNNTALGNYPLRTSSETL